MFKTRTELYRLAFLLSSLSVFSTYVAGQVELGSDISQAVIAKDRLKMHQQEILTHHADESGRVRPDLWRQGIEHVKSMKIGARTSLVTGGIVGVQWSQIGPAPLLAASDPARAYSGEVTDIAIDPRNAMDRIVYITANDGGI